MFFEAENTELLELLSQVRAATAFAEDEKLAGFFSTSSIDAPDTKQEQPPQECLRSLGGGSATIGTECPTMEASEGAPTLFRARSAYTPQQAQQPFQPGESAFGKIDKPLNELWSSPVQPVSASLAGNPQGNQLYSLFLNNDYGLSPASTLVTPAKGGNGSWAFATTNMNNSSTIHPSDPVVTLFPSQANMQQGNHAISIPSSSYVTTTTRVPSAPFEGGLSDVARQSQSRPMEGRYTLSQTKMVKTHSPPPAALQASSYATGGRQPEHVCATPPVKTAIFKLIHGQGIIQREGVSSPTAGSDGSLVFADELSSSRSRLPTAPGVAMMAATTPLHELSAPPYSMLETQPAPTHAPVWRVRVPNEDHHFTTTGVLEENSGGGSQQLLSNHQLHSNASSNSNIFARSTPVSLLGGSNKGAGVTDFQQHHPAAKELNIFALPSPPRPLPLPTPLSTSKAIYQPPQLSIRPMPDAPMINTEGHVDPAFCRQSSNQKVNLYSASMQQSPTTAQPLRPTAARPASPRQPSSAFLSFSTPTAAPASAALPSEVNPNVFLSSIARLKEGHSTPSNFQGSICDADTPHLANTDDTNQGGPPPSERYAYYLQRGVLTSPLSPLHTANLQATSQQRRPHSTTTVVGQPMKDTTTTTCGLQRNSPIVGVGYGNATNRAATATAMGNGASRSGHRAWQSPSHNATRSSGGQSTILPLNYAGAAERVSPSIMAALLLMLNSPESNEHDNRSSGGSVAGINNALSRQILAMSRDQQGCRTLQAVLDRESALQNATTPSQDPGRSGHLKKELHAKRGTSEAADPTAAASLSLSVHRIVTALRPHLPQVMSDAYGNFLIQKLLEVLPAAERLSLLSRESPLYEGLSDVACSPHGTFAVQRLVETLRNEAEEQVVFESLGSHTVKLLLDANGGHVLLKMMSYIKQKCAARCAAEGSGRHGTPLTASVASAVDLICRKMRFLYDGLQQNLLVVCRHRQGCCVTQKCIDFFSQMFPVAMDDCEAEAPQEMNFFVGLVKSLLKHIVSLAMDPYANYVITHAVEVCYARGSISLVDAVAQHMQERTLLFCRDKYASNVMEHVLRYSSEKRIRTFCRCLLKPTASEGSTLKTPTSAVGGHLCPLVDIALDPFGNYVIQTLLTVAPVDELLRIGDDNSVEDLHANLNFGNGFATGSGASSEPSTPCANIHGLLPMLQRYLPLLQEKSFARKIETKMELALLRVEEREKPQQHRLP